MKKAAEAVNRFSLDLYSKLRREPGNLFFSPFNIVTAFAMVYAGSRGETEKQMASVFHITQEQKLFHEAFGALVKELEKHAQGYQLGIANAVWLAENMKILEKYRALLKQVYSTDIARIDFQDANAANVISDWVERKTNGKIQNLLRTLDPETLMILVSAIYFKDQWKHQFKEKNTQHEPFYLAGGGTVQAPLMYQQEDFGYYEEDSLQVLALHYRGNLSMYVLLPREANGLAALEENLPYERLSKLIQHLSYKEVKVFLPRFKVTHRFKLKNTLSAMGMPNAFSLMQADFSGITGEPDLRITEAIHQAFVEVDEEGTTAAAATVVMMGLAGCAPTEIPTFRADRPFLFLIRDAQTGCILFIGRVTNPAATP
jgi:serpin B